MEDTTTKEKILKKIRNAIIYKSENPFPNEDFEKNIYNEPADDIQVAFASAFTKVGGKFIFCTDEKEAMIKLKSLVQEQNLTNICAFDKEIQEFLNIANIPYINDIKLLKQIKVGITFCEYLISRFGSIVISSKLKSGRRMPAFSETHIVIAFTSQIVLSIKDALNEIIKKYGKQMPSMISVITGPSRTADIEKTLVMGAHGPRELYVFLINDSI